MRWRTAAALSAIVARRVGGVRAVPARSSRQRTRSALRDGWRTTTAASSSAASSSGRRQRGRRQLERRFPARRREPVDPAVRTDEDPGRRGREGMPKHLLVSLREPEMLSHCPFIMMTEVGSLLPRRSRGDATCAITCSEGRVSLGRRLLGRVCVGGVREPDPARCCPRSRTRSSICRSSIRSFTR